MTQTNASDAEIATELRVDAVVRLPSAPPAGILIGYARCSTEKQDLSAQREILRGLGVARALRRPRRRPGQRRNQIPDMINITERPPRPMTARYPGHWKGDLILGKNNLSAIGTPVERTTGYTAAGAPPRRLQGRTGPRRAHRRRSKRSPTSCERH